MCNLTEPATCMSEIADGGFKALADKFAEGATWAVKTMTAEWMNLPSLNLMDGNSPIRWLNDRLIYFVGVAVFCSILVAAYRMVTSGEARHSIALVGSLMRLVIMSGTLTIVVTLALVVGDAMSLWVLDQLTLYRNSRLLVAGLAAAGGIPDALRFILAGVVIIAQLVQVCLMIVKDAVVICLVAFIPMTAAVSNTQRGFQGYERALTWLGAFVLYKPVCAAIYALAWRLMNSSTDIGAQLSGVALMCMAIFALPALIKLLAPAAAAAAGGNAGAISGAVVGASLATGAVIATGGMGAGGFAAAGGQGASSGSNLATGAMQLASSVPPPSGSSTVSEAVNND